MKIRSTQIILKDRVVAGVLTMDQGRITDLQPTDNDPNVIDYHDQIIAPGLIDIHNHGFAGWSFSGTSTVEDIVALRQRLLMEGATTMLATSTPKGMKNVLKSMANEKVPMTALAGFHSEGPFINPKQFGAAPPDTKFPSPNLAIVQEIYESSHGQLKMMTLAPELTGNEEIIDFLVEHGVKVAVGHTMATFAQLEMVKDKIDSLTHLGNAMRGIHHREIGTLGFGLLDPNVYAELIADGVHICLPMIRLILQNKKQEKILLISDDVPLAGLPQGDYQTLNGVLTVNEEGRLVNEHGHISGSSFPLLHNLRYLKEKLNLPLPLLFEMASSNPAEFLGLDQVGEIAKGKQADLLVLNEDLRITEVYQAGKACYDPQKIACQYNDKIEEYAKDPEFLNFYSV